MEFLTGSAGGNSSEELLSMERWTKKDSLLVGFQSVVLYPVLVNCFLICCLPKNAEFLRGLK
jgi:hypothetical protein